MATYNVYDNNNKQQELKIWDTTTWNEVQEFKSIGSIDIAWKKEGFIIIRDQHIAYYKSLSASPLISDVDIWPDVNESGGVKLLDAGRLYDNTKMSRLYPPMGRRYHPDLRKFASDGRFIPANLSPDPFDHNEFVLIDTKADKAIPTNIYDLRYLANFGYVTAFQTSGSVEIRLIPTANLQLPQKLLELWAQVAVRGELGPDGEFVKWSEEAWERKRQELAAAPVPNPDFPFPGYVATDRLHWLRAEYGEAKTDAEKLRLAKELLRRAELSGDRNEAVRWSNVVNKSTKEIAPPPRAVK